MARQESHTPPCLSTMRSAVVVRLTSHPHDLLPLHDYLNPLHHRARSRDARTAMLIHHAKRRGREVERHHLLQRVRPHTLVVHVRLEHATSPVNGSTITPLNKDKQLAGSGPSERQQSHPHEMAS
jgi:hypothetical protein